MTIPLPRSLRFLTGPAARVVEVCPMSLPTTTESFTRSAPPVPAKSVSPTSSGRRWAVGSFVAVAILAMIPLGLKLSGRLGTSVPSAGVETKPDEKPKFDPKTTVLLPEGKMKVAGVQVGPVRKDELATEVSVPGQVSLNPDRRVEIKPRVSGVVRTVAATIGRKVKAGETLVTLDSADVGTARLNLRARQRELITTRIDADWKREVSTNVAALIPLLRKDTPTRKLEELFRDKLLGSFRGDLLGSYAEFEIASHEEEKQAELFKNNLVGEHPVFLSKHTREAKQARFEGSLEVVRFDSAQQSRIADQQVRAAEAAVIDAAQRLRILGVSEDMDKVLTPLQPSASASISGYEDVTVYTIVAPFDGTIVARSAVPSQRVEPTDGLFSLADLTTVRVTADVPESRVGLLPAMGKPNLQVSAAAYPGQTFSARVIYVGEVVDPTTRTVSLLAEMPNPDGRLRPGMFVQIKLDSPDRTAALTVPAGSVIEIEGKTGVFRPGKESNMFTFAPVVAGGELNGRRAIVSGLTEGDPVVVAGAFVLKSELVLQNEAEEE